MAHEHNPMFNNLLYSSAIDLFFLSKDRDNAIEAIKNPIYFFECAINLNPKDYQAYNRLGDCYFIKKNYDLAIGCYQTSINIIKRHESEFKDQESISRVQPIPLSTYIGDNYIKIGICLGHINEKSLGVSFIQEGKILLVVTMITMIGTIE